MNRSAQRHQKNNMTAHERIHALFERHLPVCTELAILAYEDFYLGNVACCELYGVEVSLYEDTFTARGVYDDADGFSWTDGTEEDEFADFIGETMLGRLEQKAAETHGVPR